MTPPATRWLTARPNGTSGSWPKYKVIMSEKKIAFERAADLVAKQLASFRGDTETPTENEELMAGHIVGNLWANDLLNTKGEKWSTVESERIHKNG